MSKMINRTPLRDALMASGIESVVAQVRDKMLYQDYLNIVSGRGFSGPPPITEEQWEIMCDMLGRDQPMYPSNVSQILKNMTSGVYAARAAREGQP